MTTREIQVDGSGKDGILTWWEPDMVRIDDLKRSLEAIGKGGLLPKSSVMKSSLKYATQAFVARSGLKVRGNSPEISPLAPEVIGFEVRRPNRGTEKNEPEFIFSVVADSHGTVTIPKHNSAILPQLDNHRLKVEGAIQGVFDRRCEVFPTEMVSSCISRVIQSLGGVLVRQTGGNYFVPGHNIETYEAFADELDKSVQSKPEIVTCRFPIKAGTRSCKAVLAAVKSQASERLAAVEAELAQLGSKKQRINGKESRETECIEVMAMLKQYEEILSADLKELIDMAQKVNDAVSCHNALDFCT